MTVEHTFWQSHLEGLWVNGFKERTVGTYGFAQFQIDVRQADDDLKGAIDKFKRLNRADRQEDASPDASESNTDICEKPEE